VHYKYVIWGFVSYFDLESSGFGDFRGIFKKAIGVSDSNSILAKIHDYNVGFII